MPARASPSPSPPPPAPQSVEPGLRAAALQKIYTSALQSTLKSNSYPNFAACFPTPAKYCPTALEGVWRQLNTRLEEECTKDFEKILEERKAIDGLNSLDILVAQARERRDRGVEGDQPVVLHTLTAQQLADCRLYGYIVKSKAELDTKLHDAQQNNQKLIEEVMAQRQEIQSLFEGLGNLVGDIEGAVGALEEVDVEELKNEVWSVEQEMRDVS